MVLTVSLYDYTIMIYSHVKHSDNSWYSEINNWISFNNISLENMLFFFQYINLNYQRKDQTLKLSKIFFWDHKYMISWVKDG